MLKWLWLLPLLAFGDPWLLYYSWSALGFYGQVAVLLVYPLIGTFIVRSRTTDPGDSAALAMGIVRIAARILMWYPGLICKTLALPFLIPAFERRFSIFIVRQIHARFFGDLNVNLDADGRLQPGDLKPARGRVVK
jgi:UPF0716 family protein affecting phage T7 exclusion